MNGVAERLTGHNRSSGHTGDRCPRCSAIFSELTREPVAESPVSRVLREGAVVGLANHTVLRAKKNGAEISDRRQRRTDQRQ